MLGFILIPQDGGAVRTYGNVNGRLQTTFKMNISILCLLLLLSVSLNVATDMEYYPDIAPDDYFIEQLANRAWPTGQLLDREDREPEIDPEYEPGFEPGPAFTFQFPPGAERENTQFAVRPPDPRYYHDNRVSPPDPDVPVESAKLAVHDEDTFQLLRPSHVTAVAPQASDADVDAGAVYDETTDEIAREAQYRAQVVQTPVHGPDDKTDIYFIAIVAGCSAAAIVGVIVIGVSWYKMQRNAKLAADVEYPAYGVTGPNKDTSPTGDRKLAHSAQMYHYQHQKQQIIAMESQVANERNGSVSEAESDEENEEGDYTVYECPGLAPTGEMEVKNPLFHDDPTPATTAPTNQNKDSTPGDVINNKK